HGVRAALPDIQHGRAGDRPEHRDRETDPHRGDPGRRGSGAQPAGGQAARPHGTDAGTDAGPGRDRPGRAAAGWTGRVAHRARARARLVRAVPGGGLRAARLAVGRRGRDGQPSGRPRVDHRPGHHAGDAALLPGDVLRRQPVGDDRAVLRAVLQRSGHAGAAVHRGRGGMGSTHRAADPGGDRGCGPAGGGEELLGFAAAGPPISVTMLVMLPYFLVMFFADNPLVMTVLSYVPFSSGVAMPVRLFTGDAAAWEAPIALLILAATAAAALLVAAKIYSGSLLQTR